MPERQLVYLASPYSHPDPKVRHDRFHAALSALTWLLQRRIPAFSPIVHTHHVPSLDLATEDWLYFDEPVLEASTAIYVLCIDGWDASRGVEWEIRYANSHGIPVRYMVHDAEDGWRVQDEPGPEFPSSALANAPPSFAEYQAACGTTAIYPSVGDSTTYPLLGLAGEVGELLNKVKKFWRDGRGALADLTEERRQDVAKELGDILWYVARVASEFGLDLGQIAAANLAKLRARAAAGRISGSGDDR